MENKVVTELKEESKGGGGGMTITQTVEERQGATDEERGA